ncbi:MAG: glycosyltransferase [Butyrivibrio sp.]|nr:glycosyltransferase [Butyrivibrio sp.]
MQILYYDWDEFNGEDCRDAMRRLGYEVEVYKSTRDVLDYTDELFQSVNARIQAAEKAGHPFDLIFSFNFFPNLSEICAKINMRYVSWVFDCPHKTLCSYNVSNSVNEIHIFDRRMCDDLKEKGINTVRHTPLAVNEERLRKLCEDLDKETMGFRTYEHEVSFIGNLYDNEFNFYDQITTMPDALKNYVDAVINAQEKVFSVDFFTDESIVNTVHIKKIRDYISFENSGKYDINYDEVILDMLRKKVTVNERRHILEKMGERFDTVLYTAGDVRPIPGICNLGYADYTTRMPRVFRRSKINLNITLRSIRSGIPLRVLDVLAAGGFLITTTNPEIEENFEDGYDLAIARTPEEMLAKAEYYLEHDDERQQIAINGQKKVFDNYAYSRLLPQIIGKVL